MLTTSILALLCSMLAVIGCGTPSMSRCTRIQCMLARSILEHAAMEEWGDGGEKDQSHRYIRSIPCIVTLYYTIHCHCCFRQPGEEIQLGSNLYLSKILYNGYRLLLLRIEGYPVHFGFLLIKIHLLALGVVTIKWIIR